MEVYKIISPEEIKYYTVHEGVWYRCACEKGKKRICFASDPKQKAIMLGWKAPELIQSSLLELLLILNLSQGQIIEWITYMQSIRSPGSVLRLEALESRNEIV